MAMNSGTLTVPGSATRPTSFLSKSTNIKCSARSLLFAESSFAHAASAASSAPRGRVPAIGRERIFPLETSTSNSGDPHANAPPGKRR